MNSKNTTATAGKKKNKTPRSRKPVNVQDVGNIHKALFGFQSEKLTMPRNGHGNVNGKTYSYVTLDDLVNGIRPALEKHGLVFTQAVTGDKLITTLVHAPSGTSLASDIDLGRPSNMQDYGSRITYARRYALTALLGINAEEDIDAKGSVEKPMPAAPAKQEEAPFPDNIQPKEETPATPTAPTAAEVPMTAAMSDAFKKAKTAIDTAYSVEAVDLIKGQIEKSTRLTEAEKKDLSFLADNRRSVITFDQQK